MSWLLVIFLIAAVECAARPDTGTLQNSVFDSCSSSGKIALTFDDGPSSFTEDVLDVLKEKGVKATFFVNGLNQAPIEERSSTMQRICEEGHEIGSHTWSHIDLIADQPAETIREEMLSLERKVEEMIGIKMTIMRPPYGNINDTVLGIVNGELKYSVIQWNLDTRDWDTNYDIEENMDKYREAMENATSQETSFISLHHDFLSKSAELARLAIDYSVTKGYTPVTVSECVGLEKHKVCTSSTTTIAPTSSTTISPTSVTTIAPTSTTSGGYAIPSINFFCHIILVYLIFLWSH